MREFYLKLIIIV